MSDHDTDVLVVGAGPVGLVLARELGRLGHRVTVLERHPQPYPLPRAVAYDFEIGRYFGKIGMANDVKALSQPVTDYYEWKNRDLELLVRIPWDQAGPSGWPVTSMFSQPELEEALRAAMPEVESVTMRPGWEVIGIDEGPDVVTVSAQQFGVDAPQQETITARYVVGCDGANSFVRETMGVANQDLGYFFDWLICDLIPLDDVEWSPINWQLCDPVRPTTLVSGGPGRRRWEFMLLPGETAETMNREDVAWDLLKVWGRTPENTTLERHAVYRFQARWAEQWRRGRLLIAGDAAHLMPPFAGQGMCSGLRDALNLSWKLDRVLSGTSEDSLLDTYGTERINHLQNAIHFSIALGNVICILDEDKARERDERMIAGGADPAKVLPPPHPPVLGPGVTDDSTGIADLVGTVAPQFTMVVDGEQRWSDDVLGTGWNVFARSAQALDGLDEAAVAALERTGVQITLCDGTDSDDRFRSVELTGPFAGMLDETGMDVLVVRPDFYIYGTAAGDDVARLLGALPGKVTGSALASA